jgi:hypothetical protein
MGLEHVHIAPADEPRRRLAAEPKLRARRLGSRALRVRKETEMLLFTFLA